MHPRIVTYGPVQRSPSASGAVAYMWDASLPALPVWRHTRYTHARSVGQYGRMVKPSAGRMVYPLAAAASVAASTGFVASSITPQQYEPARLTEEK